MVKISRYVLVLIGIVVSAIAIPNLFWTIFQKGTSTPNVIYSHILDEFIIVKRGEDGGTIRMDTKGNTYTTEETEQNLPLMFFRQLSSEGRMPQTVKGVEMDHAIISTHRGTYNFMPRNINTPKPVLLPLLESQSGRVNLSLPEDFFRLSNKMEFIRAETNQVDKQKTALFTDALKQKGFVFPAKLVAGMPTTLKSKDEGYFITDSKGDLFHVKMVQGQPVVAVKDIPEEMKIIHMECVDLRTEEFYAYLYTQDQKVYVVLDEVYYLQRLPIDDFDYTSEQLRIRYDVFGKTISIIGDNYLKATQVDDLYEVIATHEERWEPRHERIDHRMFASVFPFEIKMQVPDSRYVNFFFSFAHGFTWLLINLLLVGLATWLLKKKGHDIRKNIPDLAIILITGIFGFIATRVFPNKFYD